MRIVVLHHEVAPQARADDLDVLAQADAVSAALCRLGHKPLRLTCGLNLESLREDLLRLRPDAVFNLVESLGGSDSLMHLPLALIESLGIPCTGAPSQAAALTNDKPLAKRLMRMAGLPTPDWWQPGVSCDGASPLAPGDRVIIKAASEHASVGLDDAAVVEAASLDELRQRLAERQATTARRLFAERYVEGREFNLSLLAGPSGVTALPCAEIDFARFPPDKPRIVGYQAKWDEASFECGATPRTFDFPARDEPLLTRLAGLAEACWRLFGLRGYARVDFRVDQAAHPWILEVNANPCLAPDAGFAAAVERAGMAFEQAILRILEDVQPAGDAAGCV